MDEPCECWVQMSWTVQVQMWGLLLFMGAV